ncbi:MAG TPA: nucleoside 2-deoxyribosyltransferase [Planctomycetota bacterium]|jgi:nucleoside 2-deoxyribosyltransferase|nr:nucleoside 2-deoxyribosyltransferase [Planctomycetota bacterium]
MSTLPIVYYAGPLFTDAERTWNAANAVTLRARLPGMRVLMPQEFCAAFDADPSGKPRYDLIAAACLEHLAQASVVLAILDGSDADSGTCFEAGWAVARGIPVIGLRTDWRPAEDGAANCMLTRTCHSVVRSLDGAIAAIGSTLGPANPRR